MKLSITHQPQRAPVALARVAELVAKLGPGAAARKIGVSPRTLYRWRQRFDRLRTTVPTC